MVENNLPKDEEEETQKTDQNYPQRVSPQVQKLNYPQNYKQRADKKQTKM